MRRPRARTGRLAAVIAATAVVAACGISSASTTIRSPGPSGPPITIGISLPLTKDPAPGGLDFSADGQACLRGYQLWASDVNDRGGLLGRPVKLVWLDDHSNEKQVVSDYRTLTSTDHVDLILAPFSSLLTSDVEHALMKARSSYVLVAGSAGAPIVYEARDPNFFSTNVPVVQQLLPFVDWVKSLKGRDRPRTAAYPVVDDPFADPPVQLAERELSKAGITTRYYNGAHPYTSTSQSALMGYAARVARTGADMVVIGSVDVPTVTAFINEFQNLHYNPKILLATAGPDQGQAFLNKVSGGASNADGIMVPNGWYGGFPNALSHVMVQDYIAKYGGTASDINADVAEAYSAGQVLYDAVFATNSLNQTRLSKWLHTHEVATVLGPVRFDKYGKNLDATGTVVNPANGNRNVASFIFQWQGSNHFEQVLPPPNAPDGAGAGSVPVITSKPPWNG